MEKAVEIIGADRSSLGGRDQGNCRLQRAVLDQPVVIKIDGHWRQCRSAVIVDPAPAQAFESKTIGGVVGRVVFVFVDQDLDRRQNIELTAGGIKPAIRITDLYGHGVRGRGVVGIVNRAVIAQHPTAVVAVAVKDAGLDLGQVGIDVRGTPTEGIGEAFGARRRQPGVQRITARALQYGCHVHKRKDGGTGGGIAGIATCARDRGRRTEGDSGATIQRPHLVSAQGIAGSENNGARSDDLQGGRIVIGQRDRKRRCGSARERNGGRGNRGIALDQTVVDAINEEGRLRSNGDVDGDEQVACRFGAVTIRM